MALVVISHSSHTPRDGNENRARTPEVYVRTPEVYAMLKRRTKKCSWSHAAVAVSGAKTHEACSSYRQTTADRQTDGLLNYWRPVGTST